MIHDSPFLPTQSLYINGVFELYEGELKMRKSLAATLLVSTLLTSPLWGMQPDEMARRGHLGGSGPSSYR